MENWIFILILGAIVGANSHTIVYPGKSALLSYSPARGEFPVESLFGRGFFSYIDNHGISRTVNLEPNPLLGIRVSNDGRLSADLENTVELRRGDNSNIKKEDRLKPIKEFDERPFQDSVELEKDVSLLSATILDSSSEKNAGSAQLKGDEKAQQQILSVTVPKQQEQFLLYPNTNTVLAQGLNLQPANTLRISENTPTTFSNHPIAPGASVEGGIFNSENPFLNQNLGFPVQNPSAVSNLGAVHTIPSQLPGQVFFYPTTGSINPGSIPTTSDGSASQASTGQFLLFPSKPTNSEGIVPASNEMPEIKPAAVLSPTNQLQAIPSTPSKLPSISSGILFPQGGQEQLLINPSMASSFPLNQQASINSDGMITSQEAPNQGQLVSYPTAPMTSLPSSNIPGIDSTLLPRPQLIASQTSGLSTSGLPISGIFPGNPFFPPSRTPGAAPLQGAFMIQSGNPFLSFNNKQEKPLSLPIPLTTTTSAPLFNADLKNPFLPNSSTFQGQPMMEVIAVKPNPQLAAALPASSIACDYLSVGPASDQIKDTPEVEKAKREHFLAHELALAQLAQARQNNDNNNYNQANESSLTVASAADKSPLYLTANAALDQPVTSGPTMAFEQTTVNAVESDIAIATPQDLPV